MKTNKLLLFSVIVLILALNACAPAAEPTAEHAAHPPHWTYEGEEGPSHWGELDASYAACSTGQEQSPIDIAAPAEQDLTNISFHYQPSQLNILNNGHTVQVNYDAGSYIELDGVRYDVLQFHYHSPSEHTVDGEAFPAEIHIVHKNADGNLAVVGVLLREGASNAAYEPFIDNLPVSESEAKDAGVTVDAAGLLPTEQNTYRYDGSLTTPPCSEGVKWLLMTTPVELSSEQLDKLDAIFEANNRPVQPVGERTPVEDNTP
jgi:carbonic anhydrase